ncbi:uncharacterized protein EI97DRAFT_366833 [Westerdykella ornata]|uniref:Uncharacterized protein n=1 Tax=Westerdykella ornata TaxID=318751 RepID=A0A6A6JYL5_WESOR|nr:uncharacterized protein EI97DRAFT_366833 [Westerdykella ornata]KAF2281183.1 hypothetical protein EI97DRAFT_366833 [Westerdykella ornata]
MSRIHRVNDPNHASWSSPPTTPIINPGRRPIKQLKRTSPKTNGCTAPTSPAVHASSDLRACHVCHSAPKRKRDLENYLECQSCSQRACFICARECAAGCHKQICSRCSVEVGKEGNTWCLGCFQGPGT